MEALWDRWGCWHTVFGVLWLSRHFAHHVLFFLVSGYHQHGRAALHGATHTQSLHGSSWVGYSGAMPRLTIHAMVQAFLVHSRWRLHMPCGPPCTAGSYFCTMVSSTSCALLGVLPQLYMHCQVVSPCTMLQCTPSAAVCMLQHVAICSTTCQTTCCCTACSQQGPADVVQLLTTGSLDCNSLSGSSVNRQPCHGHSPGCFGTV